MKKFPFLFAAVLSFSALPACSDKPNQVNTSPETRETIAIDMVATHAIDTEVSVAQLTFVPNSVAPWLGRVILLDDDGHLYSTDIEGRSPKPVGSGTYIDIFGLARDKAAGVFLAITKDNKIEAFIESDDYGNFSPMIYSGDDIAATKFCRNLSDAKQKIGFKATKPSFHDLTYTITNNVIETSSSTQFSKKLIPSYCKFSNATMSVGDDKFVIIPLKSRSIIYFANTRHMLSDIGSKATERYSVTIKNGLSVGGVEHVKFAALTQSNYGAGGYNTGVLALVDADANRIVFISLSYAERQLLKAINPPEDAPTK